MKQVPYSIQAQIVLSEKGVCCRGKPLCAFPESGSPLSSQHVGTLQDAAAPPGSVCAIVPAQLEDLRPLGMRLLLPAHARLHTSQDQQMPHIPATIVRLRCCANEWRGFTCRTRPVLGLEDIAMAGTSVVIELCTRQDACRCSFDDWPLFRDWPFLTGLAKVLNSAFRKSLHRMLPITAGCPCPAHRIHHNHFDGSSKPTFGWFQDQTITITYILYEVSAASKHGYFMQGKGLKG